MTIPAADIADWLRTFSGRGAADDKRQLSLALLDSAEEIDLDTAAAMGLDVASAVIAKNRYNKSRADHSLAARAAGGKRS